MKRQYIYAMREGKCVRQHVVVWEKAKGRKVPMGCVVHHVNGIRDDNRIENLEMMTRKDHSRIHSGFIKRDGEWMKYCSKCEKYKMLSEFYVRKTGRIGKPIYICKPCCYIQVKERRAMKRRVK